MIDLHSHLLPGIDDGSDSLELSRELLVSAVEEGITDLCVTPHFMLHGPYRMEKKELKKRFNRFKKDVSDLDLRLYLGNEILIEKGIDELLENDRICSLNDTRYVLIELPFDRYFDELDEYLYNISLNYQIIIAHPERYSYVRKDHNYIRQWLSEGYLLQANQTSLFHHKTRSCVLEMITRGELSFLASDSHDQERPTTLKEAYRLVSESFSEESADLLMERNPRHVLDDQPIDAMKPVRKKFFFRPGRMLHL